MNTREIAAARLRAAAKHLSPGQQVLFKSVARFLEEEHEWPMFENRAEAAARALLGEPGEPEPVR